MIEDDEPRPQIPPETADEEPRTQIRSETANQVPQSQVPPPSADEEPRTQIRSETANRVPQSQVPPPAGSVTAPREAFLEEVDAEPRQSPKRLFIGLAAGLAGLVGVFLAVDFLLLRGEEIAVVRDVDFEGLTETRDNQNPEAPRLIIPIEHVGKRHSLIISSYPQELALSWTITSPEGWHVADGRDILRSDGFRTTHFVPNTSGPHIIEIRRVAGQTWHSQQRRLRPSGHDRIHVTVRVGDRSLLPRILQRNRGLGNQPPFWLPSG